MNDNNFALIFIFRYMYQIEYTFISHVTDVIHGFFGYNTYIPIDKFRGLGHIWGE